MLGVGVGLLVLAALLTWLPARARVQAISAGDFPLDQRRPPAKSTELASLYVRDRSVRLMDLVTEERSGLGERIFDNCDILGPAVLILHPNAIIEISHSSFNVPRLEDALLIFDAQTFRFLPGTIGVQGTKFRHCRFWNVGLAVERRDVEAVKAGFVGGTT